MSSHLVTPSGQSGPTARRLRFEDETEKEAESRYRDRRRAGGRARGGVTTGGSVLPSRPQLKLSVTDRGAGPQRGGTGSGFSLNLPRPPDDVREWGWSLTRPRPWGPSEPIRETYIGHVTPSETSRRLHHHQGLAPPPITAQLPIKPSCLAPPSTTDLPINPYACDRPVAVVGRPRLAPPPTTARLPIKPSCLAPPPSGGRSPAAAHQQQESRPLVATGRAAAKQSSWTLTAGGSSEHLHHHFILASPLHPLVSSSL